MVSILSGVHFKIISSRRRELRKLTCTVLMMTMGFIGYPALADNSFPIKPIRLIVPYSAGGVTDLAGRALAEKMSQQLKQVVVVENKTGANGTMGAIHMLSTKPDGYTVSMVPIGIYRMPHINDVPYDPEKDFTYISQVAGFNYYLIVNDKSPWKNLDDFVTSAKEQPNMFNYGTPGTYSSQHIAMVQLGDAAGVDWKHIPFKGEADALSAVMGDHVQAVVGASGALSHLSSGNMRALASLGETRTDALPNVPTLQESGYDIIHTSAFGIIGPKNMPDAIVKKLDQAIDIAMQDEELIERLQALGVTPLYQNHNLYTKTAMESLKKEEQTMKQLGDLDVE